MISALKSIFNLISSVVSFIIGFFQDLVYMITLLGKFILSLPTYLSWLPPTFITAITLIFTIVVIYKVLGREG